MKYHQRILLLLALTLVPAAPLHATSVVCIRSPDSIVMAADSLLAVRGIDNPGKPRRECKIVQAGGMFFSMTGFVKDPARVYDAARIVAETLKRNEAPTDPEQAVIDAVAKGLEEELRRLKGESPEIYNKYMRDQKGTLLKVLLASLEEGTPKSVILSFRQTHAPSGEIAITVERDACPGNCDPQGMHMFVLGDRRPIDSCMQSGKVEWKTPEKAAKSLVEAVIAARTPDVGPPVDVLRIDGDGARWIERKDECPEITSPAPVQSPSPQPSPADPS